MTGISTPLLLRWREDKRNLPTYLFGHYGSKAILGDQGQFVLDIRSVDKRVQSWLRGKHWGVNNETRTYLTMVPGVHGYCLCGWCRGRRRSHLRSVTWSQQQRRFSWMNSFKLDTSDHNHVVIWLFLHMQIDYATWATVARRKDMHVQMSSIAWAIPGKKTGENAYAFGPNNLSDAHSNKRQRVRGVPLEWPQRKATWAALRSKLLCSLLIATCVASRIGAPRCIYQLADIVRAWGDIG
jgi:hypothetical protein